MRSIIIFFLISSSVAYGQITISGKMTDTKKHPLIGASITLVGTYDGTTTDSLGNYRFTTSESGNHELDAILSGYELFKQNVNIGKTNIVQEIAVKELITELTAVTITAGSFEASDKKKGTVLSSLDIVTTAGANGDITGALKTLPGTQQVGEQGGLFVRGGSATETKIFIDGTLVNNFFYSSLPELATRGRFNPFLFKGTVFSTGGYSALYGQALSAALILESTDLPEKSEANLNLSVIGAGGGLQHLAKNKRSSWGFTYNYTNLALAFAVIKQGPDFYQTPLYHQGDANFRIKTRHGGFLKYYGYFSWNRTALRQQDVDSLSLKDAFQIKNLNTFQNISFRQTLQRRWSLFTAAAFSTNRDDIMNALEDGNNVKQDFETPQGYAYKNFSLVNNQAYAQARVVVEKKFGGLNALRFGSDYFYSNEKSTYTLYTGNKFTDTVKDNLNAIFAETDIYVTNNLALKAGTRLEHSTLLDKWNLAPRASLAYKLADKSQLSFAYGIFYENPERKYLPALSNDLKFSRATHYILQYQKSNNDRTFRTELFYKKYHDLFKSGLDMYGGEAALNNDGYGYAKGAEIFWRDKKTIKNFDYWVSYSYLDTKRDYLDYPGEITPSFAATHTASLVMKKFVTKWKTGFNASYSFATGRPYYNLEYDYAQSKYYVKEQGRTIDYNNLAFSLNYLPNIGKTNKRSFIVWVLSLSNVLGEKQVYGYNFSTLNDNRLAVVPPSKRFLYLGCFLSFGTDRTQDAINNNL